MYEKLGLIIDLHYLSGHFQQLNYGTYKGNIFMHKCT